ncbi:MAG: regulatory protein RecX [Nitrospinae bacterium]|nr:regulatory protein RecX [Nitrospinota bacterium]
MADNSGKLSCRGRALKILARRAHSVWELRAKLLAAEYGPPEVEQVIHRLLEGGFLNDAEYCRRYAAGRVDRMRVGPGKLRRELAAKGFDGQLIDETVSALFGEAEEEYAVALEAAKKKFRFLKPGADAKTRKRKIFDHLVRRGFSMDTARRVVFERFGDVEGITE